MREAIFACASAGQACNGDGQVWGHETEARRLLHDGSRDSNQKHAHDGVLGSADIEATYCPYPYASMAYAEWSAS